MNTNKARISDIPIVIELHKRLLYKSATVNTEEFWHEFEMSCEKYYTEAMKSDKFIAYLAMEDNIPVGFAAMSYYEICPTANNMSGNNTILTDLYVIPEYRCQGIGYKLLTAIMEQAKMDSYRKVTLNATELGKPLYEKYGFSDVSGEMSYKFFDQRNIWFENG